MFEGSGMQYVHMKCALVDGINTESEDGFSSVLEYERGKGEGKKRVRASKKGMLGQE